MDNLIVGLVAVILAVALTSGLVGCAALLLGATGWLRRADRRGTDLRAVSANLVATQAALRDAQVKAQESRDRESKAVAVSERNAKRTKAYRQMHDKAERIQFTAISGREFALKAAEVMNTVAEHLSAFGDLDE